jgi:two-component system, OmpR family, alkaline phosphatase synthesis response regulator PhoP
MSKILIVDDEPSILNLVSSYLKAEGYEVNTVSDGISALKAVKAFRPDLVILDIMIPGMDGLEVLSHLRRDSDVYVILLTARTEETDKIIGLSVGADDYVTKPFSPRELIARVKAALRRQQSISVTVSGKEVMRFRQITIDPGARQVIFQGNLVELTAIEFDLLVSLGENRGRVLTRDQLLQKVWGYDFFGDTRVVDVHMGHLRQKLSSDLITTVRGVGYRFEDEAE